MEKFSRNKLNLFTAAFGRPPQLSENYQVGLPEMSIPNSFYNVTDSPTDNVITISQSRMRAVQRAFQAITDMESAVNAALAEFSVDIKYDRSHYVFYLPEHVHAVEFKDKELQESIGSATINRDNLRGGFVHRKKGPVQISEKRATALRLKHPQAVHWGKA